MAGLVLDYVCVFLYRWLRNLLARFNSRKWPTTTGTLQDAFVLPTNYTAIEFRYCYCVDQHEHSGVYTKGCVSDDYARSQVQQRSPGEPVLVRYDPADATHSFLKLS